MSTSKKQRRLTAATLALVAFAGCPGADDGRPRHVVVISLDTTRADQMGFYGNTKVQTPRLDRLAAESIVLDDLLSVAPSTLASHASLFTGKYPHSHGSARNGFVVNDENVTLAELLEEHGFKSAAFVGSFALDSRFNLDQGFDHYDEAFDRVRGRDPVMQNERRAASVTDAALGYLDREGVPKRLFLFAHYFDAHAPYAPPAPYDTLYDPQGGAGLPVLIAEQKDCPLASGGADAPAERAALQYAGEISYMDEHVGRLLDGLRERGVLDQALVVVTSDHGETFWEHPYCFNHGWDTYQATLHVVGMIRLPAALHGGARLRGPVSNIDLLPTMLGLLGFDVPPGVEGHALALDPPAEPAADRVRFAQATKPWGEVERGARWTNLLKARSVRRGSYKLVQTPFAGTEELYDLTSDPAEQHDLLAERAAESERVASELRPLLESWALSARPLSSHFEGRDETLRRLEGLGYVGGGNEEEGGP